MSMYEAKDSRLTSKRRQERDRAKAIALERRMEARKNSCWYCMGGGGMKKHLIVSLGEHSMLMLPPDGQRVPGHCLIVPNQVSVHVAGGRARGGCLTRTRCALPWLALLCSTYLP